MRDKTIMKWSMFGFVVLNLILFILYWIFGDIKGMVGWGVMLLFQTNILLVTKGEK